MKQALDSSQWTARRQRRDLWLAVAAWALAVRALLGLVEILLMSAWYGLSRVVSWRRELRIGDHRRTGRLGGIRDHRNRARGIRGVQTI